MSSKLPLLHTQPVSERKDIHSIQTHGAYRPDIDGLRAIAVLAVVLFHLDELWVRAGFIGVDIFFTISGFLISGIVLRSLHKKEFSLANFYRNRIRRIAPVLSVVILATLVAGQYVLLPADLDRLASSAVASQLFAANIYFTYFLDNGYFASDARLEPLLHLWSLGAEEQFYLLWPLLLITAAGKLRSGIFILLVVLATLGSFLFGQYYYTVDPNFVYYMLPTRAGQLLAGALCHIALSRGTAQSALSAAILTSFGLGLVTYSLWALSPEDIYPGFNAVPVTLGAALVIYGGATKNPVSRLLAAPALVYVGLLSYSIYLWHWPVLAFSRYIYGTPTPGLKLCLMLIIFMLSWLSYRYVETPFRRSNRPLGATLGRFLLVPSLLVICGAVFVHSTEGYGIYGGDKAYKKELAKALRVGKKANSQAYVCQHRDVDAALFETRRCVVGDADVPRILLWGDSMAAHYVGALRELGEAYHFTFRNVAHGGCPPLLTDPQLFTYAKVRASCQHFSQMLAPQLDHYKLHLISGNWEWYLRVHGEAFRVALASTVSRLRDGGAQVILLGRVSTLPLFDRYCMAKAVKLTFMDCALQSRVPDSDTKRVNGVIQEIAAQTGAGYLDFNGILCEDGSCYSIRDGSQLYFDLQHLSAAGSVHVGRLARRAGYRADLFSGWADE